MKSSDTFYTLHNGPGLRIEGMGDIIDKHDAVYRFNAYNLAGYGPSIHPVYSLK